jgi:hypothetical protein
MTLHIRLAPAQPAASVGAALLPPLQAVQCQNLQVICKHVTWHGSQQKLLPCHTAPLHHTLPGSQQQDTWQIVSGRHAMQQGNPAHGLKVQNNVHGTGSATTEHASAYEGQHNDVTIVQ